MTPTAHSDLSFAHRATVESQLSALLHHAAIAPLDNTGWIRVTGDDRVRWLNGMVTNSIQQLEPGMGNYNFLLSAQGRIQGDAYIFAEPDAILLETSRSAVPAVIELLDRFVIMDDVEIADISDQQAGLLVIGPQASTLLESLGLPAASLNPLHRTLHQWNGSNVTILHAHSPLTPRYELWADPSATTALAATIQQAGAIPCEPQALEALRILEGTPLYGTDIRDKELPQETAQTRAIHFAKGCYLGQEIVERIRSRGNVHRTFAAFRLEGTLPLPGTPLTAEDKPVGELTSIAAVPRDGTTVQLALGYVRREVLERNLPILFAGGKATPVSLPYRIEAA